jgi:hypothetical protein
VVAVSFRQLAAEIILDRKDALPIGLVKLLKDGPSMYHEINPKIPLRAYKKIAEELHKVQLSSADNMHPDLCGAIAELVSEKFVSSLPHHIIPLINEIGEKDKDVDAAIFTSTYSSKNFMYWIIILYTELKTSIPQLFLRNVDAILLELQSSRHDFRAAAITLGAILCISSNVEG